MTRSMEEGEIPRGLLLQKGGTREGRGKEGLRLRGNNNITTRKAIWSNRLSLFSKAENDALLVFFLFTS